MGFGDMSKEGQYAPPLPDDEQRQFQNDVDAIFPDSPSSRLARACGGVNNRTAQKWYAGSITPPDDVLEFVRTQRKILNETRLYDKLRACLEKEGVGLDFEVSTAQIAGLYNHLTGFSVR